MHRKLAGIVSVAALFAAQPANAVVTVITFLDGGGASKNGPFALDAGSNNYPLSVLCGATTLTLGATVAGCATVNASGQLGVAGPVTAVAGGFADGALNTLGLQADAAYTTGSGTLIAIEKGVYGQLVTLNTTAAASVPAGTNLIGGVKIDQTTPGTTNGVQVNAALPVGANQIGQVATAINVPPTNCSGTITTGNTAQNAITAQAALHGFTIANIDTVAEPLWFSLTTTAAAATTASYPLTAATATTFAGMGTYTTPTGFGVNHAISVVAATTGHKFSCTWW